MDARVSVDQSRHLSDLERKAGLLKCSLHLTGAKHTKISALLARATFTMLLGQPHEILQTLDLLHEGVYVSNSFILAASHLHTLASVDWVARASVLLQNVTNLHLGHL